MKVFCDLVVYLGGRDPEKLAENIESRLAQGWLRARDQEERKDLMALGRYFCFHSPEKGDRHEARIFLSTRHDGNLYVANIVPVAVRSLGMDQYNTILGEFYDSFLDPACKEMEIRAELSSDEQSVRDWISEDSAQLLKSFSMAANRSVPHPLDEERWYRFLLSVHHEHQNLSAEQLQRWFIEEEHWPEDRAEDLALQYEFAMQLLDYQAGHRD
jgi:hypothetical protein